MDRPLIRSPWQRHRTLVFACVLIIAGIFLWIFAVPGAEKVLRVKRDNLMTARVIEGVFEDFIPLRGHIRPLTSVYLDATVGGRVEKIHVEDGTELALGDSIVDISNTRLQLESITREAQVSEQINLMQ